jgi:methionyl-tRNA formyltransferase
MPDGRPLKIVFMGTGPFAVPTFDALCDAGHECLKVFTRPEKPGPGKGKPGKERLEKSPVRQWAEGRAFEVVAPESVNSGEARRWLTELSPDLLVVCDYGQILKSDVLKLARLGGINLHGSLLPAHRGAAPVQWAVLRGDRETGVSVIHMTPKLDAGPVISLRRTEIGPKETAGELEQRLASIGVEASLEAVELLTESAKQNEAGEIDLHGMPQDNASASRAPRLSKADGRIDWSRSARDLDCHVRGMQPWPGAFSEIPSIGKGLPLRVQIMDVDFTHGDTPLPPELENGLVSGTARIIGNQMWVACGDGWLRIHRVKPSGKREMLVDEWLRGRPFEDGATLA